MKRRHILTAVIAVLTLTATAQTELYPKHFDLEQVTLLDGPMKTAMDLNFKTLLQYDVDRLLTPYVRQSGLASTTNTASPYYRWESKHPSFPNWGDSSFNLDGHVGGHYLSALALGYAACHDSDMKARLKERMDYMVNIMKDCQDQYDNSTDGLYGFIGGQPINNEWKTLFRGDISGIRNRGGWVPFYCQHKILAGLRDAFLYGNSETARQLFLKLADWSVNVVAKVSSGDMENMLNIEHGGMNESLLDAYQLTGDAKYLTAAKKYTHKTMLNGMQTLNTTFLDGKHANTQVPKYIGMERICEEDATATSYQKAATNFWTDVAHNRTVCIGGNSVSEHFLAKANSNRYIDVLDGPESCNSNNMLKLTEMMCDRTGDASYADFYEQTMWNHILSTQDPETGGYVYFTTLRPQGYRIYSQVNQGMWCCVGTGMENHCKYGHFIYTHDGNETLYVNLFTPSVLEDETFGIKQETLFPCINPTASDIPTPFTATTTLTVTKGGTYAIAVRHPAWAGKEYQVSVNGAVVNAAVTQGTASYVTINRTWAEGDRILVLLPMELSYEECPNYTDYIAFKFGPILLGAPTTTASQQEAAETGLRYEQLQNEYAGAGRMDHAPGSRASAKSLVSSPLLIGERANVLDRIKMKPNSDLRFTIDASREGVESYAWNQLELRPFYQIHHARYMCYWYQQTEENYEKSDMALSEAANEALAQRTLDFVAPGEQQSEAGHEAKYSSDSSTGDYNTEHYRDARQNGFIQYTLYNEQQVSERLSVMFRFNLADQGRKATLTIDGSKVADITIPSSAKGSDANGFYNIEYPIPDNLVKDEAGNVKKQFVVRLTASSTTLCPGVYYIRLLKDYEEEAYQAYRFVANEWTTGDPNRVSASNITYDNEKNIIHVKASGTNNVALMLKYQDKDYAINSDQIYLVVRGTNLSTATGASYLWWLNGSNHGTQVAPTKICALTADGISQNVVAWDMTASGLYENFSGIHPSICVGQTIFGLTSTTGQSDIHDINFVSDVDAYVNNTVGIAMPKASATGTGKANAIYDLGGRPANGNSRIVLTKGRKKIEN
ncbi:MAG: glycoside hydrolase family 127 protein [Prevotella sp.]|nr:glycoside hydrolase family 127 protein [Prevotella sp.]